MLNFDLSGKRVWVAGHGGMVGSAIVRQLEKRACIVLKADRARLDLRSQIDVDGWIEENRPEVIFVTAATVGGIAANMARPGEFIYDNLAITSNVIESARRYRVQKLMFLGSGCIYPRLAAQPTPEAALMTGPLEATNEPYAVAKIAGIALCTAYRRQYGCDFISVIPTNLYGPGDNLDPAANHVVPAMIAKVDAAMRSGGPVEVWGSGSPRREFLYVDDAADAMVFLMERYSSGDTINIGGGTDMSIRELAEAVARVAGYTGGFAFDLTRPDGMPLKALDASRLMYLGWRPRTTFADGLARTHQWFREVALTATAAL